VCRSIPVLLDHLVGEERDGHDPPHLTPVLAIDGEHHVLSLTGEDIEDDVAGPRPELHPLGMEHVLG